eukprot:362342-Chlamydomonas_euryale.AAC.8
MVVLHVPQPFLGSLTSPNWKSVADAGGAAKAAHCTDQYVYGNQGQDILDVHAGCMLTHARPANERVGCTARYMPSRDACTSTPSVPTLPSRSTIMGNIVPSVVWVGLIGLSVSAWHYALGNNILPEGTPDVNLGPAASTFIAQTSAVLSLLLVFRTNASYGRWDEARKMWGLLLNRSRDIVRMGMTMIPDDEPEIKRALAKWTYATAISLRIHFQPGEFALEDFLKDTLTAREIKSLEDAPHRPVRAIHTLSQVVMNSKMDSIEKTTLGTNITQFHDILGGCERLLRAPIPVSYTRHTARFLFIWLTLLPIAIYPNVGDFTAPIVVAIAAVLCGVEEIGVQCEEPFGILPLEVICGRVKADVMKTLEDDLSVKQTLIEAGCGPREPAAGKYVSASSSATSNGRPSWVVSQESVKAQ